MESPEQTSPQSGPDRSEDLNLEDNQSYNNNNIHNNDSDQVSADVENLKREPSEDNSALENTISGSNLNNNKSLLDNQSSLQSIMQVTGLEFNNPNNAGNRFSPQTKRKKQEPTLNPAQRSFNQTTSSLFSILAGLTQQQANQQKLSQLSQAAPPQVPIVRNTKPAHGSGSSSGATLNLSQSNRSNNNCNNNNNINYNSNHLSNPTSINSSLLTLLNEKISGNVASSLQSQLKKSHDTSARIQTSNARTSIQSNSPFFQQTNLSHNTDNNGYNTSNSLLNNLGFNNGDVRQLNIDNSLSSLNPFIESIAKRTGSNIGPAGIVEAKKIIEKFTTWLLNSSQTIADHYIAPYATDLPQQKPEISASDVILAYKMMQKTQPQ